MISVSAYLIHPWYSVSTASAGVKGFPIESLWSRLSCIGRCSNLQLLNISLEASNCGNQSYILDEFKCYAREAVGLLPKINVAFTACETCKDPMKSQPWRWGSGSGRWEWKIIRFIGETQVRTCLVIMQVQETIPSRDRNFNRSSR